MRRVLLVTIWLLASASIVIAIGVRVRAHRQADPIQILRRILPWVPDTLHAQLVARGPDGSLQIELRDPPVDVRRLAELNHLEALTTPLYGTAPAQRWIFVNPQRPGAMLHLMLPSNGSPALITLSGLAL